MDLPVCPACGQSVLDENPETCPFCGASMSAKPGAKKPAPAAPAATKPPAGKPAPAGKAPSPTGKPGTGAGAPPKQKDDPFAFAAESNDDAVRVALKAAPNRKFKVVCPMCETAGYIPEAAAGKKVRCANPGCMVPVFEAPLPKPEEPVAAPPAPKSAPFALIAGVGVVGIALFYVWWIFIRDPGEPPVLDFKPVADNDAPVTVDDPGRNVDGNTQRTNDPAPVQPKVDPLAFRKKLLDERMLDIAQTPKHKGRNNRSLPFSRLVLAESYARLGLLKESQAQLPFIDRSDPANYVQERLPVQTELIWNLLAAGQTSEADALLAEAEKAAAKTPSVGRNRFDRLSAYAAVLAARGRVADAKAWVIRAAADANISSDEQLSRLRQASSFLRIYRDLPEFEFPLDLEDPLSDWRTPEWVTVTLLLASRDRADRIADWLKAAEDDRVRADCLCALSGWAIPHDRLPLAELETLAAGLTPVAKARVAGAVSFHLRRSNRTEDAERLLATAAAIELPAREEFLLPAPPVVATTTIEADPSLIDELLAWWEIARAQHAAGERDAAWGSLQRALASARAFAPSPVALADLPRNANDSRADAVQKEIAAANNLTNPNQIRIQFNNFTSRVAELDKLAQQRTLSLEALLGRAVEWGYAGEVWDEIRARVDTGETVRKEPYLQAPLLGRVRAALQAGNDQKRLDELALRVGDRPLPVDPFAEMQTELANGIAAGRYDNVGAALRRLNFERNRLEVLLAHHVRELGHKGEYLKAIDLLDALPDSIPVRDVRGQTVNRDLTTIREELYFFLGRVAGLRGDGPKLDKFDQLALMTPTEEICLWAGIALGIGNPEPVSATP